MSSTPSLPEDAPAGLRDALANATVRRVDREARRTYLWLDSASGPLFARYSADPTDIPVFAHEAAARAAIVGTQVLRAPEVLQHGELWMLERYVDAEPLHGEALDLVVRAAIELSACAIPDAPGHPAETGPARWVRRLRLLGSPRVALEVRRARRVQIDPALPIVTAHGDFHPNNLFVRGAIVNVVDWEMAHPRPAGHDLMQLWASLPDAHDRARVFEASVQHVGEQHRGALAELRYVLLVQTIAAKVGTSLRASRDRSGARRLLTLLPEVRRAVRRDAP